MNAVWLQHDDYEIVPLKPWLRGCVVTLAHAIRRGIWVRRDPNRLDFHYVALTNGCAYIHVRNDTRVVYLVAHLAPTSVRDLSASVRFKASPRTVSEVRSEPCAGIEVEKPVGADGLAKNVHITPVDTLRIEVMTDLLTAALYNDPRFSYVVPDELNRRNLVHWFLRSVAIPASLLYGQINTTELSDAVALWICPGRRVSFERMFREGMLTSPKGKDSFSIRHCLRLSRRIEAVHERVAKGPHWRLLALGAEPETPNHVLASLIKPVLTRAESEGASCYLETFKESILPFYQSLGFQIEGAGSFNDGPPFWALVKTPQRWANRN
jgi:hypothetical protein